MYKFLHELLSDKKGGIVFSCFGVWHLVYIAVISAVILSIILLLRNKCDGIRRCAVNISIGFSFGLYVADFFLMPFAYGEIDIEKLPFHVCTAMCVMGFISRHNRFFGRFKTQFALLGLISNLVYVIYPGGLGEFMIHPLSYRAVQTMIFHGSMAAYGLFVLALEKPELEFRKCYKDLLVTVAMTVWALIGNTLYNGTYGDYSHNFNWFFVVQDPFYLMPKEISPYIMPFVVIAAFFAVEMLVYLICFCIKRRHNNISAA